MSAELAAATCPDDEELAGLLEGGLEPEARARVERHIAACATCLDVLAAALPAETTVGVVPTAPTRERPAAATHPRRATGWRVPRWAVAAAVVIAAGAVLVGALRRPLGERAASVVTRLAGRTLGVPLRVASMTASLGSELGTVVLRMSGVAIGTDAGSFFRADEVVLSLAPAASLGGEPVVRALHVVRPEIRVTAASFVAGLSRLGEPDVLGLLATAGSADLEHGRAVLAVPGAEPLELTELQGGIQRSSEDARIVLGGRLAGGVVTVSGTFADDGRTLAMTLGGRALDLGALAALTGGRLVGTAEIRLDVTGSAAAPRIDGRVAVQNGRWVGSPLARLPLADQAVLRSARPGLEPRALAFDDGRAVVAWRNGVWRLPRVYATAGGILVGGRARIARDGAVEGRGTVRIPPDVATALETVEPGLAGFRDAAGAATLPFAVTGQYAAPAFTLGSLPTVR